MSPVSSESAKVRPSTRVTGSPPMVREATGEVPSNGDRWSLIPSTLAGLEVLAG